MPKSEQAHAKRLEYQKRWYAANKTVQLERTNAWRRKNRARVNERARLSRKGNAEHHAKRRIWRAANLVSTAAEGLRCRAKGAPRATNAELALLWELQNGQCGLTGVMIPIEIKPHLDHIIPVARGGAHTIDNLRWVHPMANQAKRAQSDAEFLSWWNSRDA